MARDPASAVERPADASALSLGPLSGVLGCHIAQASVTTGDLFERHIGHPLGLRKVEYSLLMLILANGPLAPKRLAKALALSAPNLTMLLDRLQERGLLWRERIARVSAEAASTMELALFDRLSRAEHAMLIELLRKVAAR